VLADVSNTFAVLEQMEQAFTAATAEQAVPAPAVTSVLENSVTDGDVTVSVRSDGPLRTTLTARRTDAGRDLGPLLV
jgi:hypothetical protein